MDTGQQWNLGYEFRLICYSSAGCICISELMFTLGTPSRYQPNEFKLYTIVQVSVYQESVANLITQWRLNRTVLSSSPRVNINSKMQICPADESRIGRNSRSEFHHQPLYIFTYNACELRLYLGTGCTYANNRLIYCSPQHQQEDTSKQHQKNYYKRYVLTCLVILSIVIIINKYFFKKKHVVQTFE